jgi:hypothetical protein
VTGSAYTNRSMPPAKKIKKKDPTYASYLHKVLKSVHPKDVTISSTAMEVVNEGPFPTDDASQSRTLRPRLGSGGGRGS